MLTKIILTVKAPAADTSNSLNRLGWMKSSGDCVDAQKRVKTTETHIHKIKITQQRNLASSNCILKFSRFS